MRSKVLTVLAALLLWTGMMAAPAMASGKGTSRRNGLTCNTSWKNTWGGVNCHGDSTQRWRMHVACGFQPDHVGTWHQGRGTDAYECNFSVEGVDVEWKL